jgi:hypothetical protein
MGNLRYFPLIIADGGSGFNLTSGFEYYKISSLKTAYKGGKTSAELERTA